MKLSDNFTEIIIAVLAIFTIGIAIKLIIKSKNNNKVNQKNISIGGNGDVVGRDKTTK